jgi:hypothetical protein
MLYMVLTGSKISMDYAGSNVKRNTSMVKYMIYNMGRINKVCIKKLLVASFSSVSSVLHNSTFKIKF